MPFSNKFLNNWKKWNSTPESIGSLFDVILTFLAWIKVMMAMLVRLAKLTMPTVHAQVEHSKMQTTMVFVMPMISVQTLMII